MVGFPQQFGCRERDMINRFESCVGVRRSAEMQNGCNPYNTQV